MKASIRTAILALLAVTALSSAGAAAGSSSQQVRAVFFAN
jgi:hypothetical protein